MKKFLNFAAIAVVAAPLFIGCNGTGKASLKTECDSLNYAFGILNGDYIAQASFANDSTITKTDKEEFCKAFYKVFTTERTIEEQGYRIGASMTQEAKSGFWFNDSTIPAKPELISKSLEDALNNKFFMNPDSANAALRRMMMPAFEAESSANLTAEQADSLNMILGVLNAKSIKNFFLGVDTTKSDIKTFIKGFNKGLKYTDAEKWTFQGIEVGTQFKQQFSMSKYLLNDESLPLSKELIAAGVRDRVLENGKMTAEEAEEYFNNFMKVKTAEKNREAAAEGIAFLTENATKEGVTVTESGLQYKVITMGEGPKPEATDKVKVHYEGTLIDGTVFDSSFERGEPITFGLNQVIKGWTEGLQLMPVGSEFMLYIPYELAYGERGAGELIGPCQALIFRVQLLDIEK